MTRSTCRVCGGPFFSAPLLAYANQPKAAQHLPTAEDLSTERGVDLEVCQCSRCGLVQLDGEPVDYWREVIRASAVSPEMTAFRQRQFAGFVERFELAGKRVLEPGCGRGEYLAIMQRAGAEAYGLEFGEAAVADARAAGLRVSRGFLGRDTLLDDAPFDAFFTLNYLEHLPDPGDMLTGIHANLSQDGVGIVEVPNFDMIVAEGLFAEFTSDHLCYFTRDTLVSALARYGFAVESCEVVFHDYIVSAVLRKAEPREPSSPAIVRLPTDRFGERHALVGESVRRFVSEATSGGGRLAIWGAGHQAFTVIATFGLQDAVEYVVDSAAFKQGCYTPATHLPIVSPEALTDDPVDAVLVMAGGYSEEVARLVRERLGGRVSIALLRDSGVEPF